MEAPPSKSKIYVVLIGSAPMASHDALIMSLDRFKSMLDSDSARTQFETALRSIQPDLKGVHAFVNAAYANRNPHYAVSSKGRTMVVELQQDKNDFYDCIHDHDFDEIFTHVTAVGSMPAQKGAGQLNREYVAFPVRYVNGRFVKG